MDSNGGAAARRIEKEQHCESRVYEATSGHHILANMPKTCSGPPYQSLSEELSRAVD